MISTIQVDSFKKSKWGFKFTKLLSGGLGIWNQVSFANYTSREFPTHYIVLASSEHLLCWSLWEATSSWSRSTPMIKCFSPRYSQIPWFADERVGPQEVKWLAQGHIGELSCVSRLLTSLDFPSIQLPAPQPHSSGAWSDWDFWQPKAVKTISPWQKISL
jgi:hypothetical protein